MRGPINIAPMTELINSYGKRLCIFFYPKLLNVRFDFLSWSFYDVLFQEVEIVLIKTAVLQWPNDL